MKIGLQVPFFDWPGGPEKTGSTFVEIAKTSERRGLSSFWVMDHLFQLGTFGSKDSPLLEAYTSLSYIATVTEKMKLGVMVTNNVCRHPGVLVKMGASLSAVTVMTTVAVSVNTPSLTV